MKKIFLILLILTPLSIFAQKPQFVIQSGLQTRVISSAISPDGRTALTVEENQTLILWDVQSGKQLQSFKDIVFADFSKDGRFLEIVRADYAFQTLDFNGKILPQGPISNISPVKKNTTSEKFFWGNSDRYYSDEGLLLAWGSVVTKYKGIIGRIINSANCYSDKLKIIASAGNQDTLNLLNSTSFKVEKTFTLRSFTWGNPYPRETAIQYIQISNDGKLLAAGHNEAVEVQELATGKTIFTFKYYDPNNDKLIINKFAFSPDGKKLLIFCTDKVVLIDMATQKELWTIALRTSDDQYSRGTICFSDNGKQVLIGKNKILNYYDVATGSVVSKLAGIAPYPVDYQQIVGDNLVVEQNTKAVNWNLLTGELQKVLPANLPIEQYNSYHLAINKKATKFYNFLSEIDVKTGLNKPFDRFGNAARASTLSLSADEKFFLHCVNSSVILNDNLTELPRLVVSDVQTKKILWKKEGIDYAQFSRKGAMIAASTDNKTGYEKDKFWLLDSKTGAILKTLTLPRTTEKVRKFIFSENDTYLYVRSTSGTVFIELATGKMTEIPVPMPISKSYLQYATFTPDEKNLIFSDGKGNVFFYNIASQRFDMEKTLKAHQTEISALSVTKDGRFLFTNANENFVNVWDLETRTLAATLYSNSDNSGWAVVTPDGRFDGTKDMQEGMYFVKGIDRIPLASLFEKFYTPHLLSRILSGEKFAPVDIKIEDLKAVPTVKIIIENKQRNLTVSDDIPSYDVDNQQFTLKIQADCPNDVVSEIQLFQNGKLVGSTRNLIVEDDKPLSEKTMLKTFNIVLNNGENRFKAIALNSQRTESQPDEIILNFKAAKAQNASNTEGGIQLHLVVIGINKYKNPKYNLNYATADATSFKAAIEKGGTGIFSITNVVFIGDDKATKDGISAELEKIKTTAKPQDVFIFYNAGHGVLNQKKEFFLVPHDVTQLYGQDDALAQKGLSANELQQFSKDIKAQKQLFILDACQSAGAIEQIVAARGAAEEKAISQLARATGTHWLTASGSEQFASEFTQLGHGTFTYVLLEALSGKADKGGDKKITVKELDAYLQEQVPELTAKYKGTPQYPASYGFGNDFPIGVVRN